MSHWKPTRSLAFHSFVVLLVFEAAGGAYLYFSPGLGMTTMLVLFLHAALGLAAVLPFGWFIVRHLRTAVPSQPSPVDRAVRHGAWIALLVSLITGVILFFGGAWMQGGYATWWIHVVLSYVGTVLLLLHCLLAPVTLPLRPFDSPRQLRAVAIGVLAGSAVLAAACLVEPVARRAGRTTVDLKSYGALKETALFQPGSMVTTFQGLASRQAFANSSACGLSGCHEGIYREWREEPHYWSPNAIVLSSIEEFRKQTGSDTAMRQCGTCHFPVSTLVGNTKGIGRGHDPAGLSEKMVSQDEGTSCVLCHSIREVRNREQFIIEEPREFVFTDGSDPLANYLYKLAVFMKPQAHAASYTRPFYRETKACVGCHERLQTSSWARGPYALHSEGEDCQKCHMPEIPLADEVMTTLRGKAKSHRFPAANVILPTWADKPDQVKTVKDFIADERMQLQVTAPAGAIPGSKLPFTVSVFNNKVGHYFPAGPETDMTEAWLEVRVYDASEREIYSSGVPGADHHLPRNAYVYTMIAFDTFLNPVDRTDVHKHSAWLFRYTLMHVVPPRHVDDVRFEVPLPQGMPEGPVRIEVALRHRKPCQPFMDWAFPGKTAPVVTVASARAQSLGSRSASRADIAMPAASAFPDKVRCAPYYLEEIATTPPFVKALTYDALLDHSGGRVDEAMKRIVALRREYGEQVYELELTYGELLHRRGLDDEAEQCLTRAMGLFAQDTKARMLLSEMYDARGQNERAEELKAEAYKNATRSAAHFEMAEYQPRSTRFGAAEKLRRQIDEGRYDKNFPYVIVNTGKPLP